MKETRKIGKRLLSAALAAALAVTTMGTQVFASPEEGGTDSAAEVSSRVLSWSWPEGTDATWDEETQTWTLACSYTTEQPLTQETLTQLLPAQITAVVQTEVATSETAEEDTVTEDTVEDTAAEEESGEPASDAAVSEGPTAADSFATPDTASAGDRTPMKKTAPEDNAENDTDTAATESQTIAENLTLTWDFSGLTFPLQTGEYTLTASLPEAYQLEEGTPAVQLELQVTPPVATTSNEIQTRSIDPNILNQFIVSDVISPSNVTIDLFDYQCPAENNHVVVPEGNINSQSNFHFGAGEGDKGISINSWTGKNTDTNGGPMFGIVKNTLSNGYPILAAGKSYDGSGKTTTEQSLAYLFNTTTVPGKQGYYDVKGLLQLNPQTGIMSYDSKQNFAEFNRDGNTGSFTLYTKPAVMADGANVADVQDGQFFPFNKGTYVFDPVYDNNSPWLVTGISSSVNSSDGNLDHYFGMHMKADFVQPAGGQTNGQDMTFEFSGDDDVWVFIDGVLIGDVGGIHDRVELSINFATGVVEIKSGASYDQSKVFKSTTIREMAKGSNIALQRNTLADNTYHTLDFFYLERGGGNSNLKLQTNLVEIPVSSVIKVDQLGNKIPNVNFDLYQTGLDMNGTESYDTTHNAKKIATGSTDNNGTLVLQDDNGQPINFADLAKDSHYFVLREAGVPQGYRSTGDVHLRYETLGPNNQGVLFSSNAWNSGSWAATTMQVSRVGGPITAQNGSTVTLDSNGNSKLFAVIMKRNTTGTDPSQNDAWYALSGDVLNGWSLSEQPITTATDFTANQKHEFQWDPTTQSYKLQFDSLPGDITKYYYMLDNGEKADTIYTIGYYYQGADESVTLLNSEEFTRQYGINAYVTNIKNYLFVQKVDESGTVIPDGAEFALYNASDVTVSTDGTYTILNNSTAYDTVTVGIQKTLIGSNTDAIAYFPNTKDVLLDGTYYLIETKAPDGYTVNKKAVKVIVNGEGVFADAGADKDGITTLVGVGSLVDSMAQFGSGTQAGLDRTLADIVAYKKTADSDNLSWGESDTKNPLYLSRDASAALQYAPSKGATNNNAYFESDTGWTAIGSINQNYRSTIPPVTADNKTQLDTNENDPKKDVKDLFSRTTVVRVADTPIGLTITKEVTGGTVTADVTEVKAQTFQFKVTKLNDSGTDVDTGYEKTVKLVSGTQKETVTFEDGVLDGTKLQISGVGSITLNELDTGKYRVEEIVSPQAPGNITIDGVVNEWKEVTYTVTTGTGDTPKNGNTVDVVGDTGVTVTATNRYEAYKYLTVTKTVDGNMGDKTKGFSFDLNVSTKNDKGTLVPYGEPLKNSQGPTGGNLTAQTDLAATNNLYTFTLKDNEKIEIKIPYQAGVTVTEPAVNGYTTSSRQYVTGNTVPDMSPNHSEQTVDSLDADYTVDFVNECTIQVPTGLHGETRPYAAMVGLAGAAALLSIAGWVELRRRKRREQE